MYSEATVGLCLSLTNYSLIPQEMLACGLPCVDLEGASAELGVRRRRPGRAGAVRRRARSPTRSSGCSTTDERGSAARQAGIEFVAPHTWDLAAAQVEAELRARCGCAVPAG